MMDWQAFPSTKPRQQSYQEVAPTNVQSASNQPSRWKDSIRIETGSLRKRLLIAPQLRCGRQHGSQTRLAAASCSEHLTKPSQSIHVHSPAARNKHISGSSESVHSKDSPTSAAKRRYLGISALFQIGEEVEWSGEDEQLSKLLPKDPTDPKPPRNGLEGTLLLTWHSLACALVVWASDFHSAHDKLLQHLCTVRIAEATCW
jgi:hypothetical protein